ncbi:TPA: hypothetical protein NJ005_000646 [Vibrio parahaemolyticus]|nr:hypothetical protein [Vibrio parahaemolyticus]HCG5507742.1 hypothetical protein [Vibrio parahaemolyticus]
MDDVSEQQPIPRNNLPYRMVKRLSILQRESSESNDAVEDALVIFYDKLGPSIPTMAIHLDELCVKLDNHFGYQSGFTKDILVNSKIAN